MGPGRKYTGVAKSIIPAHCITLCILKLQYSHYSTTVKY